MSAKTYHPFDQFNFNNNKCFLTGDILNSKKEKVQVFPQWLMSLYNLEDQPFKMLDENFATYKDLKLPCSAAINEACLEPLENEVAAAFTEGYTAINKLDGHKLFLWAGKLIYGVIFNEIQAGIRMQHARGEEFSMSQSIIHKFSYLHLMLQSLNLPIHFDDFKPYSLFLFKVNNKETDFGYRDEINTLTFSLRIRDFGMIICLQDNGANAVYHHEIYKKVKEQTLHPIQFEEFSAKVFYSNYLFNRLPEYNILSVGEDIYIEAMPLRGMNSKPLFDDWINKIYCQVLENFWKNWGFLLLEITKDPEKPMSFLLDAKGEPKSAESVKLPD